MILLAAAMAAAASADAAPKPEISWSIMHPTAIDIAYMKRVVDKAAAYGGVDSFEVCGDCHSPYGGINGLSMLEPYPRAHALVDPASVEKARREMREICRLAHGIGKPLYYWHREIFIPKGLLEDLPSLKDEDGEFDLLGDTYRDYLRFKLDATFKHCPELDGVVLTLTEADFSVIHNSNPKRYPPKKVVEHLVRIFAEEHEKRGKRFILRSFGSNSQDYEDIIGGAVRAARDHGFEIETKVTEADFVPWLPKNPFLKKNPPLTLGAECDALGEYLGAGYLPAAQVARIREYVASAREEDVDRFTLRIDRVGNSIFDSAHEVNLYAYMRFIRDPAATVDGVIAEYAAKRFGAATERMAPILKGEMEMVRNLHYIASNLTFHSFPIKPNFKTLKAGGIFSVYREGADLVAAKDIWSILDWMRTPSHAQILAEKEKGLAAAERGLKEIESLKPLLPPDEYVRQHRAFSNAVKGGRALRAYTRCAVAYFDDMSAAKDEPDRLLGASESAVREIESMMADVNDNFTGKGSHFNVVGGNLDRVYFVGLRFFCRELVREYRIERAMRRRLERVGAYDFVIPGGIYDDNRVIRTMHGAYSQTKDDRVVRFAGNPVFPNGTISVKLAAPKDARIAVALDPDGAQTCRIDKSWKDGVWTVTVGKKGTDYPGVLSIAALRPDGRSRVDFRRWSAEVDVQTLAFSVTCIDAPGNSAVVQDGRVELPEGYTVTGKTFARTEVDCDHLEVKVERDGKGKTVHFRAMRDGVSIQMPEGGRITGTLLWGPADPGKVFAVRADAAADGSSVVSGPYVPAAADALFDVASDRLLALEGAKLAYVPAARRFGFAAGNTFKISVRRDFLAQRYGVEWRLPSPYLNIKTPPVGWMTWYAVKFDASDSVVMENARAFMENFRGYNDERPVLWVDWEWGHGKMKSTGLEDEDVTRPRAAAYPRGMAPVAADLKALGFTPALWVSVVNDCRTNAYWRAHPEWVLGERLHWCGLVWGDPSAPGFCEEYVPALFNLYRSWGYEAFKWDTLPLSTWIFTSFRNKLHDPSMTPEEVYLKMVRAGRKALGDDTFMLYCAGVGDRCNLPSAGVFDAMRVGGDIFSWDSFVEEGANRIIRYQPLHGILVLSDADNLVLRPEFSNFAQARTRVSVYGISGVPITMGDAFSALDRPRIDLLKRVMPVVPVRPASLAQAASVKAGGLLPCEAAFSRPWGEWQVKSWSNFDTNAAKRVAFRADGCAVWDFWNDRALSLAGGEVAFEVPPADTVVARVTPLAKAGATLLSVSRHIMQGGYELEDFGTDAHSAHGAVKCPGRETVKVSLLLPEGHGKVEASHPYDLDGRVLRLKLSPSAKGTEPWRVTF